MAETTEKKKPLTGAAKKAAERKAAAAKKAADEIERVKAEARAEVEQELAEAKQREEELRAELELRDQAEAGAAPAPSDLDEDLEEHDPSSPPAELPPADSEARPPTPKMEVERAAIPDKTPAELMPDRAHLEGCPANPERIETYKATKPAEVDKATGIVLALPKEIVMVHCVDCGETVPART